MYAVDGVTMDFLHNCLLEQECARCPFKNRGDKDEDYNCKEALTNHLKERMDEYFEQLEAEKRHHEVLKRFCLGKWQDSEKVEAALNIDWNEGTKRFDWGRNCNWNPYPWNGQYVITKFRIKGSEEPWPDEHWRNIKTDPDRKGEYKDDI